MTRGVVTGERTPYDGDIDLTTPQRVHDRRCRIRPAIVAIKGKAAQILDDAAPVEGTNRWRIGSVVADDLDADLQPCELRIVEGCDLKSVFATGGEHVCRAVIGLGGAQPLQLGRNPGDEIAAPGIERVANEAAPLGTPGVFEVGMEGLGDDSGDRVLEAL